MCGWDYLGLRWNGSTFRHRDRKRDWRYDGAVPRKIVRSSSFVAHIFFLFYTISPRKIVLGSPLGILKKGSLFRQALRKALSFCLKLQLPELM